jgi:hypothetical protein
MYKVGIRIVCRCCPALEVESLPDGVFSPSREGIPAERGIGIMPPYGGRRLGEGQTMCHLEKGVWACSHSGMRHENGRKVCSQTGGSPVLYSLLREDSPCPQRQNVPLLATRLPEAEVGLALSLSQRVNLLQDELADARKAIADLQARIEAMRAHFEKELAAVRDKLRSLTRGQ